MTSSKIWHTSEKESYLRCGEAYRLEFVDRIAPPYASWWMVRGDIIHRVFDRGVEHFNEILVEVLAEVSDAGLRIRKLPLKPMTKDELKTEQRTMLEQCQNFFRFLRDHQIKTLHSELPLKYQVAGRPHEGTLDRVVTMPDTPPGMVEIFDYKTGVRWAWQSRERKMQFGDYVLAATQNDLKVNRIWWGSTRDLEIIKSGEDEGCPRGQFLYPVSIQPSDTALIHDRSRQVIGAIEAGFFPANGIVHNACLMCAYSIDRLCPSFSEGENRLHFQQLKNAVAKEST